MKLCECGCGQFAPIAKKTNKKRGWVKGKSLRFIQGHNGRLRPKGVVQYEIDHTTKCWVWKRSRQSNGYGHLTVDNQQVLAHRFVYEQNIGTIPEGMELDHLCRNPPCVNPDHLEPVSHAENCRRGMRAKLDRETATEIRTLHRVGATISGLAQKFAVSRKTIRTAIKGESWS